MPIINQHPAGSFCWVDMATIDAAAAKQFYLELFGWTATDIPAGDAGIYTMLQKNGVDACALYEMDQAMKGQGIPPFWQSYISVDDVDAKAAEVTSKGGNVLAPPFDVMDVGRMAVVQDPTGASFALWQSKDHKGARLVNEPGALCWNELWTNDIQSATDFYTRVFGWTVTTMDGAKGQEYTLFQLGDRPAAGMLEIQQDWGPVPPNWAIYFAVDDCDAALEQAKTLGGRVEVEPMEVENVGRFGFIQDPQGARFAVIKLNEDQC